MGAMGTVLRDHGLLDSMAAPAAGMAPGKYVWMDC